MAGAGGVRGRRDGHCSGRYASYWNVCICYMSTHAIIKNQKETPLMNSKSDKNDNQVRAWWKVMRI